MSESINSNAGGFRASGLLENNMPEIEHVTIQNITDREQIIRNRQLPGGMQRVAPYEVTKIHRSIYGSIAAMGWARNIDSCGVMSDPNAATNIDTKAMLESIAKVCHEANGAYCASIGDNTGTSWEDAPRNIKAAAIAGVKILIANPELTSCDMHEAWLDFKTREGWVFGEVKDIKAKTHPCLVPYDELSAAQQTKDIIFSAIVRGMAGLPAMEVPLIETVEAAEVGEVVEVVETETEEVTAVEEVAETAAIETVEAAKVGESYICHKCGGENKSKAGLTSHLKSCQGK